MRGLRFDQARFDATRETVKNEVRQQTIERPYGRFVYIDIAELAQTKWNNAHSIYGEMETLDAATIEDARNFFRTYYAPNNAALVIYGDFDPAQTRQWVKKYFEDIPSGPPLPKLDLSEPRQTKEQRFTRVDPNAPLPAIAIAYHLPPRNSPEFWAIALIDQLLVQGRDSRLHQAIVERLGLSDRVDGGVSPRHGSLYTVNGPNFWAVWLYHDRAQSADSILAALDAEIERLRSAPVGRAELGRAITKARPNFYFQSNYNVGLGRADMLGTLALFDDDPARINRIEDEFRKVTPGLILKTAQDYLRRSNRTVVFLKPKE